MTIPKPQLPGTLDVDPADGDAWLCISRKNNFDDSSMQKLLLDGLAGRATFCKDEHAADRWWKLDKDNEDYFHCPLPAYRLQPLDD